MIAKNIKIILPLFILFLSSYSQDTAKSDIAVIYGSLSLNSYRQTPRKLNISNDTLRLAHDEAYVLFSGTFLELKSHSMSFHEYREFKVKSVIRGDIDFDNDHLIRVWYYKNHCPVHEFEMDKNYLVLSLVYAKAFYTETINCETTLLPDTPENRKMLKKKYDDNVKVIIREPKPPEVKKNPATIMKRSIKPPSSKDLAMDADSPRSKAEIMAVLNSRMQTLRNLYYEHKKEKPGLNGKITLKFTIAPSGSVAEVSIVSSETGNAEFDNAVKNAIATLKWKPIKGGDTTPTITFDFTEQK